MPTQRAQRLSLPTTLAIYYFYFAASIGLGDVDMLAFAALDLCRADAHCLNGGKCMAADDVQEFRHCHCAPGFSGPRCSKFQCPHACENGGYCKLKFDENDEYGLLQAAKTPTTDPNDYICKCFGHFTGKLCETSYTNCGDNKRCYNGGSCVMDNEMAERTCLCPTGFGGASCETVVETSRDKEEDISVKGKKTIMVLSILLVFLGATLALLLNRKRRNSPPKFVVVGEEDEFEENNILQMSRYEDGPSKIGSEFTII